MSVTCSNTTIAYSRVTMRLKVRFSLPRGLETLQLYEAVSVTLRDLIVSAPSMIVIWRQREEKTITDIQCLMTGSSSHSLEVGNP